MIHKLLCNEITPSMVDGSWRQSRTLGGFFGFERYERSFSNTAAVSDCHVWQVYPAECVDDWPQKPAPPHPSVFGELFPGIVHKLLAGHPRLYLHMKGVTPGVFDELAFLRDVILPRGVEYMLLSPISERPLPGEIGNLIFECPMELLEEVLENWFGVPVDAAEGYVMKTRGLGRLAECYFQPDSMEMIRQTLRVMRLGFRLWPDFNGIDVFSEQSLTLGSDLDDIK